MAHIHTNHVVVVGTLAVTGSIAKAVSACAHDEGLHDAKKGLVFQIVMH